MANQLAKIIQQTQERFLEVKPGWMNYEAEKGFAIQLVKNNGYLSKAVDQMPASLQQAITNIAAIGLSLNPAEKLAYLIPRNVKDGNNWVSKVFLEPSYMGLCKLATDSGSIKWVQAAYVCADDTFEHNGPGNEPKHNYQAFKTRGDIVGFYCVAKTADGDFLTELMTIEEIHGIRDRSESWKRGKPGKRGPWESDFTEQAKKTVVRRAFKMWPKTDQNRMALAVDISNNNEGFEPIATSPNISSYNDEQKEYFDQLISQNQELAMFVFLEGLEQSIQISLNRSFEHGSIGKYQKLVNSLKEGGRAILNNIITSMELAINNDDTAGCAEIMVELSQQEQALLYDRLHDEYSTALRRIMENNND